MSLSLLFRHLVRDNPMMLEGTRAWRRFMRTGGDTGRGVNTAILGLLGILYLWLLCAIVYYREDMGPGLVGLELVILTLFVPASLYGAISGEREKLTWDALILTRLTPGQILIGKLLWRLVLVAGVMAIFLPPILLSHFAPYFRHISELGAMGVGANKPEYTLRGIAQTQGLIFGWSFLLSGFTLAVSARTKRSVTSLSLISVALLAFLVLIPVLVMLFGGSSILSSDATPLQMVAALLLHLNPMEALFHMFGNYNYRYGYNQYATDMWRAQNLDIVLPWMYAAASSTCLFGAWRTLRGLEAARKRVW